MVESHQITHTKLLYFNYLEDLRIPKDIINIISNYTTVSILEHTLNGHDSSIFCLAVTPDNIIISGSGDHTIKVWKNNLLINTLIGHTRYVECLAILQNGDIASGSYDTTIKIWRNYSLLATLDGHNTCVKCLKVMPNN